MTKKYICELCSVLCILEVEKDAYKPYMCPFHKTKYPQWHIFNEGV